MDCCTTEAGGAVEDSAMEELVLPKKFRKAVLNLAHSVPTAAHLGKRKTATAYGKGSSGQACTAMWQTTARAARRMPETVPQEKSAECYWFHSL